MLSRVQRQSFFVPLVAIGLAFFASGAVAQEDDGGLIVEARAAETGRPLAGVEITITDREGGRRQDKTGPDGSVDFGRVVPGLYDVTAAVDGRVTVEEPSVRVSRRKTTPLSLGLVVTEGPLEEIVVVARGRVADQFGAVSNSFFQPRGTTQRRGRRQRRDARARRLARAHLHG